MQRLAAKVFCCPNKGIKPPAAFDISARACARPLSLRASRLESTEDTISTLLLETSYYSTTKTNPVWLKGPQDMSYLAEGNLWNRLYCADLLDLFCKL